MTTEFTERTPHFQSTPHEKMPSDLAKKKAAKKKEAAKARQRTKKTDELNEDGDQPEAQTNGAESNGQNKFFFFFLLLHRPAAVRSALRLLCFSFNRHRQFDQGARRV